MIILQWEQQEMFQLFLNNVTYSDEYEGSFEDRRVLTYTLTFTAKFYLYGPSYRPESY